MNPIEAFRNRSETNRLNSLIAGIDVASLPDTQTPEFDAFVDTFSRSDREIIKPYLEMLQHMRAGIACAMSDPDSLFRGSLVVEDQESGAITLQRPGFDEFKYVPYEHKSNIDGYSGPGSSFLTIEPPAIPADIRPETISSHIGAIIESYLQPHNGDAVVETQELERIADLNWSKWGSIFEISELDGEEKKRKFNLLLDVKKFKKKVSTKVHLSVYAAEASVEDFKETWQQEQIGHIVAHYTNAVQTALENGIAKDLASGPLYYIENIKPYLFGDENNLWEAFRETGWTVLDYAQLPEDESLDEVDLPQGVSREDIEFSQIVLISPNGKVILKVYEDNDNELELTSMLQKEYVENLIKEHMSAIEAQFQNALEQQLLALLNDPNTENFLTGISMDRAASYVLDKLNIKTRLPKKILTRFALQVARALPQVLRRHGSYLEQANNFESLLELYDEQGPEIDYGIDPTKWRIAHP